MDGYGRQKSERDLDQLKAMLITAEVCQLVLRKLIRLVKVSSIELRRFVKIKHVCGINDIQMNKYRESVFAVRDTELIQFPTRLLHHIKRLNHVITEHVIRHISRDLESSGSSSRVDQEAETEIKYKIQAEKLANISTIAITCSDENCPIDCFIEQLKECLSSHGNVICLSSTSVEKTLGRFALTDRGSAKVSYYSIYHFFLIKFFISSLPGSQIKKKIIKYQYLNVIRK